MRRISHISDLHFGRTDPAVVEGLIAELNADAPDLVIVSGDFTMAARRPEYEAAQAFLARLASRWIAVPGNHDISPYHLLERFAFPFARYRRYIALETEPVFTDDEIGVLCLNTVRTWAPERNWSHGRITRGRIVRAEAQLAAMPAGLFKIVVGHHPFMPPPWDEEARLVGRADLALSAFRRQGVRLTLAGHLHRHYARTAGDTGEALDTGSTQAGVGLLTVQAGSATSTRLRGSEPNAYNRIVIEGGGARVGVRLWTGRAWADAEE